MAKHTTRKVFLAILIILLLLAGGALYWLYRNIDRFKPEPEAVTYINVTYNRDTTFIQTGVKIRNQAPLPYKIDSVKYDLLSHGKRLGWGRQQNAVRLPALSSQVLDFNLYLHIDQYRQLLAQHPNQDSLPLDLAMRIFLDPPFLGQQTLSLNRPFNLPLPKGPALQIDSLVVQRFTPDSGYTFLLKLNTGNANLPGLAIEDLQYQFRLSDQLKIQGKLDSAITITPGEKEIWVPLKIATNNMVALLDVKLGKQKIWPYQAEATALLRSEHPLFKATQVSFAKNGTLDTRKIGGGVVGRPSVVRVKSLRLNTQERQSYLAAEVTVHNPTSLPLFLDSARYQLRHQGKVVAYGSRNFYRVFPAKGNQNLPLQLTINNRHYQQMTSGEKTEVPLEAEVVLFYNQPGSQPQTFRVKKPLSYPVTSSPEFELADIRVKKVGPKKGAQLLLQLAIKSQNRVQLNELDYHILVDKNLEISGKTRQIISIDTGTSTIEVPVDLSARDVNLLAKGLIRGKEIWDYTFTGTANVTLPNTLFQDTKVNLNTTGVFNINSKGTPDYMPEISKIDTLIATIHYDTAFVRMYAAIYNTLPVTIHVSQLEVDVKHENELMATTREKLNVALLPDTNSFAWHSLGINYGNWEAHVKHHQQEDSILLQLPVTLTFELQDLGRQQVKMDLDTRIPTPATPVTLLERMKLRGFSFKTGLQFDALVAVQNANSEGLTVKNIDYQITLENGVDLCGKINRTYQFPIGLSEVKVPVNLSVWEGIKLFSRQLFGPPLIKYQLNATATLSTNNPKLSSVYVIFENRNQSNLKEEKTVGSKKYNLIDH